MKKIDDVFAKLSELYEFNVNIKKYKIKKKNKNMRTNRLRKL